MGFLDFLFKKSTRIEHEFFGIMLFQQNKKDPLKSYFECKRHFAPTGKIIEIGIDADVSGPTQKQVDFFKSIEDNYADIAKAVTPLIENELNNWKTGFKIGDFSNEFIAVYLQLPRCENSPVTWEIAFESNHDSNHTFNLTMSGLEAKEILIDG